MEKCRVKAILYNGISEEMQNGYEQKKFISNECFCFIIKITLNNFFKMQKQNKIGGVTRLSVSKPISHLHFTPISMTFLQYTCNNSVYLRDVSYHQDISIISLKIHRDFNCFVFQCER